MTTVALVLVAVGLVAAAVHQVHFPEQLGRWAWTFQAAIVLVFVGREIAGEPMPGEIPENLWWALLFSVVAVYEHRLWRARRRPDEE